MKVQAIIVAGGKGKRMKTETPKQFLSINGLPILMHTIKQFADMCTDIILVLPKDDIELWEDLKEKHQFNHSLKIVEGGTERFYSVKNAIDICDDEGLILVHDGVRPLASKELIENIIKNTELHKACIPCIPVDDSMRQLDSNSSKIVDRSQYRLVQTPQGFNAKTLIKAYNQDYKSEFTDDASVVESLGQKIFLVEGEKQNIKITSPTDLALAEFYLKP
jgi:2-C-methyl-D-erythritol 4-phosphate cytidylyltransferase